MYSRQWNHGLLPARTCAGSYANLTPMAEHAQCLVHDGAWSIDVLDDIRQHDTVERAVGKWQLAGIGACELRVMRGPPAMELLAREAQRQQGIVYSPHIPCPGRKLERQRAVAAADVEHAPERGSISSSSTR